MKRTNLTYEERVRIQELLEKGLSMSQIATEINRSKNCVVVEVRLNGGMQNYSAIHAQRRKELSMQRRSESLSNKLKGKKPEITLTSRVQSLEMQIEIILDEIRGIKNANIKNK